MWQSWFNSTVTLEDAACGVVELYCNILPGVHLIYIAEGRPLCRMYILLNDHEVEQYILHGEMIYCRTPVLDDISLYNTLSAECTYFIYICIYMVPDEFQVAAHWLQWHPLYIVCLSYTSTVTKPCRLIHVLKYYQRLHSICNGRLSCNTRLTPSLSHH